MYEKVASSMRALRASVPWSSSWFPKVVASSPRKFSPSIAGLSSKKVESAGVAPMLSPPVTKMVLGFAARAWSMYVFSRPSPP